MQLFSRALGWGIVIYAIMYLAWSGLVIYGLSLGMLSLIARLIVLFVITMIATSSFRLMNWKDILPYSSLWAVTAIVLDALFLVPFTGWGLYASWSVWMGYLLLLLVPLLQPFMRRRAVSGVRVI